MEYLRIVQSPVTVWLPPIWSEAVPLARSGDFLVSLTPITLVTAGIGLVTASALLALIKASPFGRAWRAYADDSRAAALFGVDGPRLLVRTLALSGAMAGLSGMLIVAQYGGLGFAGGFQFGLKALIAAIIGGIGSIPGAMLGGAGRGAVRNPLVGVSAHRGTGHRPLRGPRRVPHLPTGRASRFPGARAASGLTEEGERWATRSRSTTSSGPRRVVQGQVLRTPLVPAPRLSQLTGATVCVKHENMQPTGSFKERGAVNKLESLGPDERRRGVIAMSAGNHAQAVAYHARRLGIPATIVMPEGTPLVKAENTRAYGARVILVRRDALRSRRAGSCDRSRRRARLRASV